MRSQDRALHYSASRIKMLSKQTYVDVVAGVVEVSSDLLSDLVPLLFTQRLMRHLTAIGQSVVHRQLSFQQSQLLLQVFHHHLCNN